MNATGFLSIGTGICPDKEAIVFEDKVAPSPMGRVLKRVLREHFKGVKTS